MNKKAFSNRIFATFLFLLIGILLVGCGGGKSESSSTSSEKNETENQSKESSQSKDGEVFELNINNWAPSTHHIATNVYEPWKEMVEEKTDGRVKVNIYHGATLGKTPSVYQDVKGGLYEVGLLAAAYSTDTEFFPYSIGNLPFAVSSPEEGAIVLKEFADKHAEEGITDIIAMEPFTSDPYNIFSTKPIKSAEDLKKTKVRASDKSETALVKALDGIPVSITVDDTYEGLQKKTIETTFYSPVGAYGYKFYEPAPYITKASVAATTLIPVMNKEFHDKLPDDLKKLFDEELNPALTELFVKSYSDQFAGAFDKLKEVLSDRGEIIELPEKELENFKEAGEAAWDAWVKDANERGYEGDKMIEDFRKLLEEN